MTKAKISEYDPSASNNTDVNGVNIAEGCAPSGINDAIREVMAALKRFETGSDGDSITVGGNLVVSGATTANVLNATTIDTTNIEVTNIKAKDGTASVSIADSTGIPTISKATVIQTTDNTNAALRITQLGTGNALLVEDSANPDASPFVIDASGQVIVGSDSAITYATSLVPQLQVNKLGAEQIGISRFSADTGSNALVFLKSRGTTFSGFDVVSSGDGLGTINWYGADGTAGIQAANISAAVDGTPGTNDMPGRLVFSTTADGASSPTERMRIDSSGNLKFNSGYGSVATAYGCRAWVNFDGTSNSANLTGTYSQSGTTVTVTITDHGYITGNSAYLDFTSGTAVDGTYTVTVVNANTFTVTQASRTTSGNVTDRRNTIRASGNVSSITDNGTGDYTVNFATAMPDANYSICGQASLGVGGTDPRIFGAAGTNPLAESFEVATTKNDGVQEDCEYVCVSIFR